ncbi:MAG: hypothetical protein K0S27_547 [Gammaproteobacteria bacterium]|jgi:hydroxyacylglutathione hydrolase|nr:hypothetical protein [Gammaproteobacteria bacterium]
MSLRDEDSIVPLRALKDNYIWLLHDKMTNQAWVVDPGDAKPVIHYLDAKNLILSGILITHHHADHSAGVPQLLQYAGDIPVFGPADSLTHLISCPLREGEKICFSGWEFTTIAIPGHTLDHIAYAGADILFCGDTLFSAGCGRIFEGDAKMMYRSLAKLNRLDDQTKIYCGHEYTLSNLYFAHLVNPHHPAIVQKIKTVEAIMKEGGCTLPSLLKDEKRINPFLGCHTPEIITAVEKYTNKKLDNPVEVFYYLREWKNLIS